MRYIKKGKGIWRRVAMTALVVVIGYSSVQVHRAESARGHMKTDRKEISHITYGLFNVDAWRNVLAEIITCKVQGLEITPENREDLKKHVESLMYEMLDEVEKVVEKRNKKSGFGGMVRQVFMDVFVDIKTIRQGVPRYADLLLNYLNDPKNRQELTGLILQQFDRLAEKTVGQVDYTVYNAVVGRYGCTNGAECIKLLDSGMADLQQKAYTHLFILLGASIVLLAFLFIRSSSVGTYELSMMVAAALCLLATGVSLPMIDIEATISDFSFQLMGEPVVFKDQVLFYQSKSILDVVHLLITDGDPGLVLVGALILLFSVLIPVSKIIASLLTIHLGRAPRNLVHRFLVLKSGKWSMADVMVVAIFMAFIGFRGIVSNQMAELQDYSSNIQVLTTNNSGLQIGFYLFLSYCLMGLLLGLRLEKWPPLVPSSKD
jgi:hypothetical protein